MFLCIPRNLFCVSNREKNQCSQEPSYPRERIDQEEQVSETVSQALLFGISSPIQRHGFLVKTLFFWRQIELNLELVEAKDN